MVDDPDLLELGLVAILEHVYRSGGRNGKQDYHGVLILIDDTLTDWYANDS